MATSVREYLGVETKYRPEDMPTGIDSVYVVGVSDGEEVGFNDGFFVGQKEGYDEGHTEGYEAGKQESKDTFWRGFTNNGARKSYYYAFFHTDYSGETIPEGLCKPQEQNSTFRAMDRMFHSYRGTTLPKGIDASLIPEGQRVGAQVFQAASYLTEIYDMGIPDTDIMTSWYAYCYALHTIEKIRVNENTTYGETFLQASALKNVTFEGVIGQNISFAQSPLTVKSMLSVITHLKDYSGTTSAGTYTLTLKDSCKTLMAEQGEIEELGGKTYDQYITDIGWNLA